MNIEQLAQLVYLSLTLHGVFYILFLTYVAFDQSKFHRYKDMDDNRHKVAIKGIKGTYYFSKPKKKKKKISQKEQVRRALFTRYN